VRVHLLWLHFSIFTQKLHFFVVSKGLSFDIIFYGKGRFYWLFYGFVIGCSKRLVFYGVCVQKGGTFLCFGNLRVFFSADLT